MDQNKTLRLKTVPFCHKLCYPSCTGVNVNTCSAPNMRQQSALTKARPLRFRDWSLITGRVGATKREGGGQVKFYPYEKGGGG